VYARNVIGDNLHANIAGKQEDFTWEMIVLRTYNTCSKPQLGYALGMAKQRFRDYRARMTVTVALLQQRVYVSLKDY
jgi:hypothetical protein